VQLIGAGFAAALADAMTRVLYAAGPDGDLLLLEDGGDLLVCADGRLLIE